jgi:hypothetical protein
MTELRSRFKFHRIFILFTLAVGDVAHFSGSGIRSLGKGCAKLQQALTIHRPR